MASLQDQLLKAGVIDQKKAKKIGKEKRKQARQLPKGEMPVDENKEQAKRVLADKAKQDKLRSKSQQAKADKKAIHAQVVQLIKTNTIDRNSGEIAFQFTDNGKIKKIYVTPRQQNELIKGQIAIAKLNGEYALLPARVAEKINQRELDSIVLLNSNEEVEINVDDPYADYQIPDDLMW